MRLFVWLSLMCVLVPLASSQPNTGTSVSVAQTGDLDGDGLPDAVEQALLERFLPRFFLSQNECSEMPAEFALYEAEPRVVAANGTIYGQAFPVESAEGERIELHYFHLWAKDCGRWGHPLDAEHVSVLLGASEFDAPAAEWRALYWYAAAHEDTVCDVSHGAHARTIDAEERGAKVWISRAKHASYLSHGRCKFGCGGDECKKPEELAVPQVINIGEEGRPLNGAIFISSSRWPLGSKLGIDFTESVRQQLALAPPKKIVAVNEALPPVRATILAGEEILGGVGTGTRHTDDALKTGSESTGNALKTGKEATGNALGRAFRATKRFLNGESTGPAAEEAVASPEVPRRSNPPVTP